MRLPKWVAQLLVGDMVKIVTEGRAFSNGKAKRELGWELRGGTADPFYSDDLFQRTAAGIPQGA